jgi:hypothetical protein
VKTERLRWCSRALAATCGARIGQTVFVNRALKTAFAVMLLVASGDAAAQAWNGILDPDRGIDWAGAGVGRIPERPHICATLPPSATALQINAALAACPAEQTVLLGAGTYSVDGNIIVPSRVTLRGAGAGRSILDARGLFGGAVITLGGGSVPYRPLVISGGADAGSSRIAIAPRDRIEPGMFLVIAETNDDAYVSSQGISGNCHWCDGGWTKTGNLARGQIVKVTAMEGATIVAFSPPLYTSYTNAPVAVPFKMSASYAGVENLQVRANNTGYEANFSMAVCAFCWIKGVESNYADGEHVSLTWGYHDEVRDSYFSNEFMHHAGERDADIQIALKTTASLVENNIIERGHQSVMLEWGAAGNVVAYNYMTGAFDRDTPNLVIGGIDFHGAHPQFNLLEGNIAPFIYADPFWGTSSHTTAFRNWLVGTTRVCSPLRGRGTVDCSGFNGHYAFNAARAVQNSYLSTRNSYVANVIGSAQMQSLARKGRKLRQSASVSYPVPRGFDDVAYGWTFGYSGDGDDGSGTGCSAGGEACHADMEMLKIFMHANYNGVDRSIGWAPGNPRTLPASFYLSGKPAWWGSLPFPSIGPDISGNHAPGNSAAACYTTVMGGTDGGAGSPLSFDPDVCYRTSPMQEKQVVATP